MNTQPQSTNDGQQSSGFGVNGLSPRIMYIPIQPSAPPHKNWPTINPNQNINNQNKRKRQSQLSRLEAKVKKMEEEKKVAEEEKCKESELAKLKKVEDEKKELEVKVAKLEAEKQLYLNQTEPRKDKSCIIS